MCTGDTAHVWSNAMSNAMFAEHASLKVDVTLDHTFHITFGTGDALLVLKEYYGTLVERERCQLEPMQIRIGRKSNPRVNLSPFRSLEQRVCPS